MTAHQVAAFFDMDESALRIFDETWGVSAVMNTLGLDGMYLMGAVVLFGGFGWIHIGENDGRFTSATHLAVSVLWR